MRIYTSPKEEYKWIFQPFRKSFKGAKREAKISQVAKQNEFRYLNVIASGDTLYASYCTEKDTYDFASRFLLYCKKTKLDHVIYVERNNDEHNALIVIKNNEIKQDKIGNKEEIENILQGIIDGGDIKEFTLVNYQFLENGFSKKITNAFNGRVENLSAALTDKLEPTDEFLLLPEKEAMRKIESRKPWLLYIIGIVFIFIAVNKLVGMEEKEVSKESIIDPYESFYQSMRTDAIQVRNRMAQDYNNHVGLLTLPGWTVDKVIHTKGQVSYRMTPSEKGSLDVLNAFAEKNNLLVMINPNEIVILGHGANVPISTSDKSKLYNVEDVHHFIRDAVNEYIPGAEVTFLRDIPKGNKWTIRELMFQFRGIFKEDLITLGAIMKGLPVSIGGDNSDPNAGQYIVDKERFTGGIKISVFGDKL